MNWKAIEREKPNVVGIHPEYSGLLIVRIPLSQSPPREWANFFNTPVGVSISLGMHPPELKGGAIEIWPPDQELADYVRHVDARISSANERYEREVLPSLEARALAQEEVETKRRDRIAAARERLEKI